MRASGNSVVELQAVIEKSVVLGLATNTASTSNSLAELMTTYASTLATQVKTGICACAQQTLHSAQHAVVAQLAVLTARQLARYSSLMCGMRVIQSVLVKCRMMLEVVGAAAHFGRNGALRLAWRCVCLLFAGSLGRCAALLGDGARGGQHQRGCAQGQDLQVLTGCYCWFASGHNC